MANRVYVSIIGSDLSFISVCTEDIQVQAGSEFSRIGEMIPGIEQLTKLLGGASTVMGGGITASLAGVQNSLDVPIWNKTKPVTITMDLNFFLKTSGYYDVWVPTMSLQSMTILSKNLGVEGDQLITPGMNIGTIGKINQYAGDLGANALDTQNIIGFKSAAAYQALGLSNSLLPDNTSFTMNSKICAVYIPGIVYLPMAMVEQCQPTWSKQLTSEGFPIWSKVNIQFTGLYPAVFETNFASANPKSLQFVGL